VTSTILKFTWYDHLKKMEIEPPTMPVALPAVHP
jgi:hypothetical protein